MIYLQVIRFKLSPNQVHEIRHLQLSFFNIHDRLCNVCYRNYRPKLCRHVFATINEAMRLYPSLGLTMPRVAPMGDLEISGTYVTAGCDIGMNAGFVGDKQDTFLAKMCTNSNLRHGWERTLLLWTSIISSSAPAHAPAVVSARTQEILILSPA